MKFFGIPAKPIKLSKTTIKGVIMVKIQRELSSTFPLTSVKKGNAVACLFFNFLLEYVIQESRVQTNQLH